MERSDSRDLYNFARASSGLSLSPPFIERMFLSSPFVLLADSGSAFVYLLVSFTCEENTQKGRIYMQTKKKTYLVMFCMDGSKSPVVVLVPL